MRPNIPSPDQIQSKPNPIFHNQGDLVIIENVINNLPYSCIVDIASPMGIDYVYYAALNSKGEKLFYKSERPSDLLPSFSSHDLKTDEVNITFICWPVTGGVIGKPTQVVLPTKPKLQLGTYELNVLFSKEDEPLFKAVIPIIEQYYGKAALPGLVKVEEATYDIFLPGFNKIRLSANKRNLIHELIHVCRKQLLFAYKDGRYHQTTEMIEEFFAEGVANLVKDELNKQANSFLIEGAVYGSTMGYNYDFRLQEPSIYTQDLQSTSGGITFLESTRYYLASEAYHKVALEYYMNTQRHFGKDFNEIYYAKIQGENPAINKELFFDITSTLIDRIEGLETRQWLTKQKIFDCENRLGEKIYMDFNDYPMHDEWIGIVHFYCYETFENGSDWAIGEKRYSKNGSPIHIEVSEVASGNIVFSKNCKISDYPNGYGFVKTYFYHKKNSPGIAHFTKQNQQSNTPIEVVYVKEGLFEIRVTTENAQRTYHRFMGETMLNHRDKFIIAYPSLKLNAEIELIHKSIEGQITQSTKHSFEQQMCVIDMPLVENKNCLPGILSIHITENGQKRILQRNIGYGGSHGGQQFLIKGVEIEERLFV